MTLCENCQKISLRNVSNDLLELPAWWPTLGNGPVRGMILHENAREILHSRRCCTSCELIWRELERLVYKTPFKETINYHGHRIPLWNRTGDLDGSIGSSATYILPKLDTQRRTFPDSSAPDAESLTGLAFVVPIGKGSNGSDTVVVAELRLYALPGSLASVRGDIVGRPALTATDDHGAHALLKRWLASCKTEHPKCRRTLSGSILAPEAESRLPTRIVDVGAGDGSENPKLLETRELRAEYVALSHCWGPPESHPLKTTWSNLHSHQSEIPWVAIPKTFQDAISTVRGLGLRYIWIDSLCIVQDDSDEWLRESKRMNSVYQNAVLTLASCHSPDAHTGCYLPRPPMPPSAGLPNFMESSCNAGTLRCSGEENEASVFLALPHQSYRSLSPESSPLAVRAWATQEWLLSRRMVFFTEGSLTWSCKTYTQRETGEKCHNTARNPKWKHIIEHYSIRKLSHWTDRMVALEGLAAELQPLIRGVYRWGIWENGCPDQLFWYAKPSTTPAQPRVRYNPLGAPTWSWVSFPYAVRYGPLVKAKSTCEYVRLAGDGSLLIKSRCAPLQGTVLLPSGDHPRIIDEEIHEDLRRIEASPLSPKLGYYLARADNTVYGWALLDYNEHENIHFLSLMSNCRSREEQHARTRGSSGKGPKRQDWVLVLRKIMEADVGHEYVTFQRLGVAKLYRADWWEDMAVTDIRVV